jgi:hypothetical protein
MRTPFLLLLCLPLALYAQLSGRYSGRQDNGQWMAPRYGAGESFVFSKDGTFVFENEKGNSCWGNVSFGHGHYTIKDSIISFAFERDTARDRIQISSFPSVQDSISIDVTIYDDSTKLPVRFADVFLFHSFTGIQCDGEGHCNLKIAKSKDEDDLLYCHYAGKMRISLSRNQSIQIGLVKKDLHYTEGQQGEIRKYIIQFRSDTTISMKKLNSGAAFKVYKKIEPATHRGFLSKDSTYYFPFSKSSTSPSIQYRLPVGAGPSSNTWPK